MDASKLGQIEAILRGDLYRWAVAKGLIRSGDSLRSEHVTVTQADMVSYLEAHPVPGLDVRQATYRSSQDGPKIFCSEGIYRIGWQERGMFFPEFTTADEAAARRAWIKFLAASFALAA